MLHPEDVVADFQQFYGIALPPDPAEFDGDARRLALLWTALPLESRTVRRIQPSARWDDSTHILRLIEHDVRMGIWSRTKDAEHGVNQPEPLELPWVAEKRRDDAVESLSHRDEVARALGIDPARV